MKFRCERDVLVEALSTAHRATTSRAALPVLSGLRLALSGDRLRVTGSDLDLTITTELQVAGSEDGEKHETWASVDALVKSLLAER